MFHHKHLTKIIQIVLGVALGLNLMMGVASATPSSTPNAKEDPSQAKYQCPDAEYLNNVDGHGANNDGGYQSTCDETDFGGNGQETGPGKQTGKPCAGCVGNADDKNPPGQFPDGSDSNSGYECDGRDRPSKGQQGNGNHGVGDENPAHTGCGSEPGSPAPCPDGSAPAGASEECPTAPATCPGTDVPMTDVNGDGVVNSADCKSKVDEEEPATCPGTDVPMTDVNGDGVVNSADCKSKVDEEEPATCPGTDVPMTDVNGDGVVNSADCKSKVDEEEPATCPGTDVPMTDVNGDGVVNSADCKTKVDEEKKPEVTVTEVSPVTITPVVAPTETPAAPAAPEVAAIAALDAQPERVAAAPAAPARPTQVLGVQLERADLARTGLPTNVLVLLAGALLIVGALLVRTGRPSTSR